MKFYPLGLDLYKVCQRNQLIWSWNQFIFIFFLMLSWDSVTITDGTTTNKYCGTTIPTSISSTTGSLSVNFIADVHTGGAGFEFDYACNSGTTTTARTTTTITTTTSSPYTETTTTTVAG